MSFRPVSENFDRNEPTTAQPSHSWAQSAVFEAYPMPGKPAQDANVQQVADMSPSQAANFANAMMRALGIDPSQYSAEKLAEIQRNAMIRMNALPTRD